MIAAPQHEVKPAAAVIADDVICQSFIQSSSTLVYACLLIRRRQFDLAAHVLHSLEAKQASRFKDMVFYLQAQIGIETGEYAMVKKRLVPRVHQHPNDMVALSLLECCIYHEFAEWEAEHPAPPQALSPVLPTEPAFPPPPADSPFGNAQAASAAALASSFEATALPEPDPVPAEPFPTRAAIPTVAPAARSELMEISLAALPPEPSIPAAPPKPATALGREATAGHRAGSSIDTELGAYQSLAADAGTQALSLWNASKGRSKTVAKNPELEPLMALLARELPGALQAACASLEGGTVHKICFSFNHLTATTFHAGPENMALVTGPLNQSLLAIVRAENTFKKSGGSGPGQGIANTSPLQRQGEGSA